MPFHTITITTSNGSVSCSFFVELPDNVTAFYDGTAPGSNNILSSPGGKYHFAIGMIETKINAFSALNTILTNTDTEYKITTIGGTTGTVNGTTAGSGFNVVQMTFVDGCFNEGTKILCLKNELEEYVPVENLRKGDVVKTYKHGYKPVDLIGKKYLMNHPENDFTGSMYKMVKTPTNGLTDDLIVTGGHSLLVDAISEAEQERFNTLGIPKFSKNKIEDKHLLLAAACADFVKLTDINTYTYYHFILENDDDTLRYGVWSNGILTESMNRNYFMKQSFILL